MKPPKASDRARARLKEELAVREISQRDLADALSKQTDEYWSQGKVGKVLTGHVELKVDDADAIAKVAGIFLTEVVRDRGLEFYAEMTPTELRLLEVFRQRPADERHALLTLLRITQPQASAPKGRKRGRPLASEIPIKRVQ